jgi:predicted enzyme related to lactoylglutathione lyase
MEQPTTEDAMPRPVHFEIQAEQPERASRFYSQLFGWEFTPWAAPGQPAQYWLIKTGPEGTRGIDGGMLRRPGPAPSKEQPVNAYVCTIEVASVDESFAAAIRLGGTEALPKMPIPGVGWLAYAKDTEGNIFGLMTPDKNAR